MTKVSTSKSANFSDTIKMFDKFIENAGLESVGNHVQRRIKKFMKKDTFVSMGDVFIENDCILHNNKTIRIDSHCEEMTSVMMGLEDFLAPLERTVTITEEFTRKV